ncbi:MAG: type I-MYXAN CRISPR-associated protein Cmx8, partial [Leptospiraceae bacterium]|nr:type I-MYXAN CRISPR-associated protein Cmx8 [Leptospiraceae bacterium]
PITIESDKIRKKGKGEDKKDNPPINQYLKKIKTEVYIYESKPKSKKEEGKVLIREIQKPGKLGKLSKQYIYEEISKKKKTDSDKNEITPIRTDTIVEEKMKYVYEDTYPYAPILCSFDGSSNSNEEKIWVKLWRDMVWSILRGIPTTRNEYKTYQLEDDPDIQKLWKTLFKYNELKALKSQNYIGSQEKNAELVDFKDIHKHLFILNFSPITYQIYVPKKMEYHSKIKDYKLVDNGYIICVPDIKMLKSFCDYFPDYMNNRNMEIAGYRPKESIVYLPQIAGYDSFNRIHTIMKQKLGDSFYEILYAQDILHCEKDGNNIRIRGSIRLKPDFDFENKVLGYKRNYHNYLFQKKLIENTLLDKHELSGLYSIFTNYPHEYFYKYWEGGFKIDASNYFKEKQEGEQRMSEEGNNNQDKVPKSLETLVFQIIQSYIYGKLESKFQLKWDDSMKGKENPKGKDFSEKKEKISKEAFLAIRSRKDKEDFINYFTSTICSVSQRLGEEGYLTLVKSLYEKESSDTEAGWEKIRALSMLALSANS